MVIMEVTLPSGFTVDNDALPSILNNQIKRIETKDGDSVVMLYFDKVSGARYFPPNILQIHINQLPNHPDALRYKTYYNDTSCRILC